MYICDFEKECGKLKHGHCPVCRTVRIKIETMKRGPNKGICRSCVSKKKSVKKFIENDCLPIWYEDGLDKGKVRFDVPTCLKILTYAEKMLIQLIAPFVPLSHIKNGVYGLKGHVCAFEQDIEGFVNTLPREQNDVTMIRVVQMIRAEIGSREVVDQEFLVRKNVVIEALEWLKLHSVCYKNIKIEPKNMDWIEGEEGYLDTHDICVADESENDDEPDTFTDNGPAPQQAIDPAENGDNIKAFGFSVDNGNGQIPEEDEEIAKELREAIRKSKKEKYISVDWPKKDDIPIGEYETRYLFPMAFPWLFPGGRGDATNFKELDEWGQMMLYYEDGRFAKDKIFCFFALNYIVRHKNNTSGMWFVNNFHANCPESLEELTEQIENGNLNFINNLTYYNRRQKGSTPYWNLKRSEVYAWINYHYQMGHGIPSFFITLSCAEYFWPDIIKLIKERMDLAGEDSSECYIGSKKLTSIVNDYSIVVQEYFQERVKIWLETVGKKIFRIKHYWCRFEFAPGRGQIHTHLLAITDNKHIYEHAYDLLQQDDGEQKRAEYLAKWAKNTFGLTASVGDDFEDREVGVKDGLLETNPVTMRFTDLGRNRMKIYNDGQDLLKFCQYHDCSGFCLKHHTETGYVIGCGLFILNKTGLIHVCYKAEKGIRTKEHAKQELDRKRMLVKETHLVFL